MKATQSSTFRRLALRGIGFVVAFVLSSVIHPGFVCAANTKTKQVNVMPGKTKPGNVGVGFGDLSDDEYELNLELEPAQDIIRSEVDANAGDIVVWHQNGGPAKYTISGVTPDIRFWVIIRADLKSGGGGGRGDPNRWMSVSDIDLDADTDNDSTDNPRQPSETDCEDYAEYPGYLAPSTVPGLVLGVNDDHDEFLPNAQPWARDYDNSTADLTKEGTNYGGNSVGLAQLKLKIGVARAPGRLTFSVPSTIQLFEGEDPTPANMGTAFLGDRDIPTPGTPTFTFYAEGILEDNTTNELVVTYTPETNDGSAIDTLTFLPVRMDIDVDSDNSGTLDGTDAEDLIEAKPSELGILIPLAANPDDRTNAKPGILRGLYSQNVTYLLEDHSPVITLKRLSASTGHVRVWKVRQGQDPVLMLDTSAGGGSTTQDGESNSLFDLLGDASSHDILITALTPGEVLLGLEITVNGAKVAMDVVKINGGLDLDINVDNHPHNANGLPLMSSPSDITDADDATEVYPGGYLWINDDNDNNTGAGDTILDRDDSNLATAMDDDLEPIRLTLPHWRAGNKLVFSFSATLRTNVRIWHEQTKTTLLTPDAQGRVTIEAPNVYDADGDGIYWVEGLGPTEQNLLSVFFYEDSSSDFVFSDHIAITVFGVVSVQPAYNSQECHANHTGDPTTNFETDPTGQTRTGLRIFPAAYTPGDTVACNVFKIRAQLYPAIPTNSGWQVPVHVKAYDVDHYSTDTTFDATASSSSAEAHDPGHEPNDNRTGFTADPGATPNFGTHGDAYDIGIRIHAAASDTVQHIISNTAADIRWADRVSAATSGLARTTSFVEITQLTPCNNWRFAAGCGNTLEAAVRINNAAADGETLETIDDTALDLSLQGSVGRPKSTETLTVWRKLWIECDYITPVDLLADDEDRRSAQDNDVNSGAGTATVQTDLDFDHENQFQGGTGQFWDMGIIDDDLLGYGTIVSHPSGTDQPVTFSYATPGATDYVYIADDDVATVNLRSDPLLPLVTPGIADTTLFDHQDGFPAACVQTSGYSLANSTGSWYLYATSTFPGYSDLPATMRGQTGNVQWWVAQVVEVYQGAINNCFDPDGGLGGISCPYWFAGLNASSYGGVMVFVETVRDWAVTVGMHGDSYQLRRSRTTLHEVGHVMDGRHEDGGLMTGNTGPDPGGGMFSATSLKRFMLLRDQGP